VTDPAPRLVRFARALRAAGVGVVLRDELDAAEALRLVGLSDRDEVARALRTALKVRPEGFAAFDRLLEVFWTGEEAGAPPPTRRPVEAPRVAPAPSLRWDPDARRLGEAPAAAAEGRLPGYSPEALLRRKRFDEPCTPAELAAMERILARLARRLASQRSRRLVPTPGRGVADLRRSLRRALSTQGELVRLAHRTRGRKEPRLVFLCDTSGSMDRHSRFLLAFAVALRRAARRAEVFAFNTELVRVTPWLSRGRLPVVLDRLAAAVPDWSGGTRIGESLRAVLEAHAQRLDARTVVVILSDGLDRGEPEVLRAALRRMRRRVRKIVWLNPLLSDPRYEPTARGMQAALPFVDHFAAAHDLASLERLLPHLAA
jgi:uncharacterized protein